LNFDLVVIGSGPGGYVAALKAAKLGLKVACIEKEKMPGGTCLRVGCIPSKALLHATELVFTLKEKGKLFGCKESGEIDFSKLMASKQQSVEQISAGVSLLFEKERVTRFYGHASFIDPHTVKVEGKEEQTVRADIFLLATGSEPISLPFLPFDEKKILSSTDALQLKKVPKSMLVIGAGAIGLELASVYSRLGTQLKVVEMLPRIAPFLDQEVGKALQKSLEEQGIHFFLGAKVLSGKKRNNEISLEVDLGKEKKIFASETVLVAIGRKPYTEKLRLDVAGVSCNEKGQVIVGDDFRTSASHIYAIGDLIDGPMLAHKASMEAIAVAEALAGKTPSKVDYLAVPNVIYTYPEACSVGMTEEQAKEHGFTVLKGVAKMSSNPRACACFQQEGLCKVIGDQKTGALLGIHLLGAHASEMVSIGTLAIKERLSVRKLADTCFPHPTLAEVIKEACLKCLAEQVHG
jgi:dihydrolipoamide dehydrogenase